MTAAWSVGAEIKSFVQSVLRHFGGDSDAAC
jgi:hypothetical protein